jgi:NAD(P)H-dependent FMN reductase
MRLLIVCGSLQRRSTNRAALEIASSAAVARGAIVYEFDGLAAIPAFDPDRGEEPIGAVDEWRRRIDEADAILVCAPEYAGGVAGAVKNAFDWLVGSANMYRKPVAVITAGTTGGEHARRAMAQTLTWQGAYVVAELGISAPRTKMDGEGRFTDVATIDAITRIAGLLVDTAAMSPDELRQLALRVAGLLGVDSAHVISEP